jgi:hypothetical protein
MNGSEVCPANINVAGRRRRMVTGVIVLAATVAAHAAFVRQMDHLWVLAEFPLLFFGWLCLVQAADRT